MLDCSCCIEMFWSSLILRTSEGIGEGTQGLNRGFAGKSNQPAVWLKKGDHGASARMTSTLAGKHGAVFTRNIERRFYEVTIAADT